MLENPKVWVFIKDHWELIALVASELLAFVPAKWNGLAQSIFKVIGNIFKKRKE